MRERELTQCYHDYDGGQCSICEKKEEHEGVVVTGSNAIVDPWAVVIVATHAALAYRAVLRTLTSCDLAVWAVVVRVTSQKARLCAARFSKVAWI